MPFNDESSNNHENLHFTLSSRLASLLIAAGLLILFFSFMVGYFWGKQNGISQFCMNVEQSSFADRIYTSMCELSDSEVATNQESAGASEVQAVEIALAQESDVQEDEVAQVAEKQDSAPLLAHHAQLVGYGSELQAEKFVKKLAQKGIQAHVASRKSKSSKGKVRLWYQVVTEDFTDKSELESLVARISKEERLNGVRIVRS